MKRLLIIFATTYFAFLQHTSTAQTAAADNKISQSITFHPIPKGTSVFGVFDGRPLCQVAEQLKVSITADCIKLKWRLTLYKDPGTGEPATYSLYITGAGDEVKQEGGSYRQKLLEGKWKIIKGVKSNPAADVYQLELGTSGAYFYLLKGDENVLFVLDENKEFRVGNEDFSYTLNRVELVPGKK